MKRVQLNDVTTTHPEARFFFLASPAHHFLGQSYTSSDDEMKVVEAKIVETKHKVSNGYKITLKPIDNGYAHESFYQMDFIALCREQPDNYYVVIEGEKVEII